METEAVAVIAATVAIASLVLWLVARLVRSDGGGAAAVGDSGDAVCNGSHAAAAAPAKKSAKRDFAKGAKQDYAHPLLVATLKGHSGLVNDFDFSCNGKHLVTTGSDRSIILWYAKDFADREHRTCKGAIEYDTAAKIRFFPDSKSLLMCLSSSNELVVYKLVKKDSGHGFKFQMVDDVQFDNVHKRDIAFMDVSCDGRFVMTASTDLHIVIWGIRGELIKELRPKLSELYSARISPCGRLVAASGFTPDVKVYEVQRDKAGLVTDAKRAYELKGHNAGVHGVALSQDSGRAVTASKDGTWRLYDTDIRFNQGEEAHLLLSADCGELRTVDGGGVLVEIAPDGASFAFAIAGDVLLFTESGMCTRVPNANGQRGPARAMRYSADGAHVAVVGGAGAAERHVRLLANAAGLAAGLLRLKKQHDAAGEPAARRRLAQRYDELWAEAAGTAAADAQPCAQLFDGLKRKL